jgi:uncharacterized membrane protein YbhN (UPF0104 family)
MSRSKHIKTTIQIIVALGILALLVYLGYRNGVIETLRKIDLKWVAAAFGVMLLASVVNALRWLLLLRNVGIKRDLPGLLVLYLIGFFFSQFMPSGTGGDVVRIYEVAKRSGRIAGALMATLQERFFGVGIAMFLGFFASIYHWNTLPPQWRIWVMLVQIAAPIGMLAALYPHAWADGLLRLAGAKIGGKIRKIIDPILRLPPIPPGRLLAVSVVTATGVTLSIAAYAVVARAMEPPIPVGLVGFIMIVPLVWVISMAGIFGGLGFREAAIPALLAMLFGVDKNQGFALAAVYLALTLAQALLGGALLAIKVMTGTWIPTRDAQQAVSEIRHSESAPAPANP